MHLALHTLPCTLPCTSRWHRYADRAKSIKVKAFKNEEVSLAEKLSDEIAVLRLRLQEAVRGGGGGTD
jgi:hypothetical protein